MAKKDDLGDIRKAVLKYLDDNKIIGKRLYIVPIQKIVTISKQGIKHVVSKRYGARDHQEVRIKLLKNIPKIIVDSYYMGFEKNTKKSENIVGVHNFHAITVYERKIYSVWIKVKETRDLTFVYDMGIIQEL